MNRSLFFLASLVVVLAFFASGIQPSVGATKPAAPDASPSPAPQPPSKLEGVWEVQMQRGADTTYTHFKLAQDANGLTGIWRDTNGKVFPITGSYDGKNFRVIVAMPDKSVISFSGYVDSPLDMVGIADYGKESVPFTAAHRLKVKFLDSVGPGVPLGGGL